MLDFCAEKQITADTKLIHPRELNHAMDALAKNAAHTQRFVIDIAALDAVKDSGGIRPPPPPSPPKPPSQSPPPLPLWGQAAGI